MNNTHVGNYSTVTDLKSAMEGRCPSGSVWNIIRNYENGVPYERLSKPCLGQPQKLPSVVSWSERSTYGICGAPDVSPKCPTPNVMPGSTISPPPNFMTPDWLFPAACRRWEISAATSRWRVLSYCLGVSKLNQGLVRVHRAMKMLSDILCRD